MKYPEVINPFPKDAYSYRSIVRHPLLIMVAGLILFAGCQKEPNPSNYVARVGNTYLTQERLGGMVESAATGQDSLRSRAREQIIQQWITNQLLYQEAQQRGLATEPDVNQLLEDNRRSVLVSALVSRLLKSAEPIDPSEQEIQEYYDRHQDRLRLHEPYLRVRYLRTSSLDSAYLAHRALRQALYGSNADSVWNDLVVEFALWPEEALALSGNFYPASKLFADNPVLREQVEGLDDGEISRVIPQDKTYHVVQLVKRFPPGTKPRLEWIRDRMRERLIIELRKQIYARQVERLRSEALADNNLEIN